MLGKQLTRANFSRCVSHPRDSLLFTTKMYGHRPWEPVYTSGEAVRVGRGSSYLDVIIRYNNPGFGRGEFSVDHGWILEQQWVNRGRTLRIRTYSGHVFQITRRQGGEYVMETYGYWCTKA